MKKITSSDAPPILELDNLLPEVFNDAREEFTGSDLWLQQRFSVARGERILLRAASGKGKTSLCTFITGKRTDYSGRILLDGHDTRAFSRKQWAKIRSRNIAWLPQGIGLFPTLTALENIQLKNALTSTCTSDDIIKMLSQLEMDTYANRQAGQLSWGQQQRIALVRALCQPFDLLLLDEPVSHLDPQRAEQMASLIDHEASRRNAAVIVTSVGVDLPLPGQHTIFL